MQMGQKVAATRLRKIKFCVQTTVYSWSCAMQVMTLQRLQMYFSRVSFVATVLMPFEEIFRRKAIQNINSIVCFFVWV
jgi:hypothetical protein